MPYNTGINRQSIDYSPTGGSDVLVPEPMSLEIIQELPTKSAAMELCKKQPMSTRTQRMPVLNLLPKAYWVNGDSGLKQTTTMGWKGVELVVEELAAIVPIPDAYLADAGVPLWNEIKPRLVEALAQVIDSAIFFGTNKPSTWSDAIIPAAIAAGNARVANNNDLSITVSEVAELVELDGFGEINGFVGRPGMDWRLERIRNSQGDHIYQSDFQNGKGSGRLYGKPFQKVANGAWQPGVADLVVGDWDKAIIGLRQDITFKMFDQGVLNDADGKVVWNAMQQDGQALRVVMRLAFATVNPVTVLNDDENTRFPFGVLLKGSASS